MKMKTIVAATLLGVSSFAANAALLDSLSGTKTWHISGLTAENSNVTLGNSGGWETTWAVGTVDQIFKTPISSSNTWNAGEGGVYLNYMIYGIADAVSTNTGTGYDLYNTGATMDTGDGKIHIDVYRSAASIDLNNINTSSRCGFSCFTGLTDAGSLYLSLVMSPQYFSDDFITTLFQQVSALELPATGSGFFFADVDASTGATGSVKWNTNGVDNVKTAGFDGFDFGGSFDLRTIEDAQGRGLLNSGTDYQSTGWGGYISDPLSSRAIPEPGSMALAGLGLVGLAALRRRKQA